MVQQDQDTLIDDLRACRLCADQFAQSHTAHEPRPVLWFQSSARILIAGQAPGLRVYKSGRPFTDPSGDRLRNWLGMSEAQFYDLSSVAIVPMAFCFPGYSAQKADLPPPPRCARHWHHRVMAALPDLQLRIVIGGPAHRYHLGVRTSVTETVKSWRRHVSQGFPLPHPSWRNSGWLKKNPWFEDELLPELRSRVKEQIE